MKVYIAHSLYRYEADTNPSGLILGVYATESLAKHKRDEEAMANIKDDSFEFFVSEHEVQS